jgi:hypothetical protein
MKELQKNNFISFIIDQFDFKEGDYFVNLDCVHSYEFVDRIDYAGEISVVSALSYNYVKPIRAGLLAMNAEWNLAYS